MPIKQHLDFSTPDQIIKCFYVIIAMSVHKKALPFNEWSRDITIAVINI